MKKNEIEALEKRIGERITIGLLVPHKEYTGNLVGYDGEHFIFDENKSRVYISKHIIRFPN